MKYKYIIIACLIFPLISWAQDSKTNKLKAFHKVTTNGVLLKFAPTVPDLWMKGIKDGYNIERREMSQQNGHFVKLNEQPILPFKIKNDYKNMLEADSLLAFNQNVLWNNTKVDLEGKPIQEQFDIILQMNDLYGMYLLKTTRDRSYSKISGLEFFDSTALDGKYYQYRISMASNPDQIIYVDVDMSIKGLSLPMVDVNPRDKLIRFSWPHKSENTPVLCYEIEKSIDGKNFSLITKSPLYFNKNLKNRDSLNIAIGRKELNVNHKIGDHINFKDSLIQNYTEVFYRMRGIDIWGEYTSYSDVIKTNGIDLTPPVKPVSIEVSKSENSETNDMKITWNYDNKSDDFIGFLIYHSQTMKGEYKPLVEGLLSPKTTQYIHKDIDESIGQYYRLAVLDSRGNYNMSDPYYGSIPDVTAPSVPLEVKAKVDAVGVVSLSWAENIEKDLKGYIIFASNDKGIHFTKMNQKPIFTNNYTDTVVIDRLDHFRYYKVVAVDKNFNGSDFSDVVKVILPDIVAPSPGKIDSLIHKDNKIQIYWLSSCSNDVKSQTLWCKVGMDTTWLKVDDKLGNDSSLFLYTKISFDKIKFALTAQDSSDNISIYSKIESFRPTKTSELALNGLEIVSEKGYSKIKFIGDEKYQYYMIYKKEIGGYFNLIKSTKELEYLDVKVTKGKSYEYYVIGQTKEGEWSNQSDIKSITF